MSDAVRARWNAHRGALMRVAVAVLALFAAAKLADEFRRLLFEPGAGGAIDLRIFQDFVKAWFARQPVYQNFPSATYPPASYLLLYPFVGWLDFTAARWLWALITIPVLFSLVLLLTSASQAESRLERIFIALMLLSMNATGVTIGNGQRILHILPALLAALILLEKPRRSFKQELAGAALFVFALVQPTLAIPFAWLVLFSFRGWRPIGLIAVGYVALTLFAASFQSTSFDTLVKDWLALGSSVAFENGYANLNIWLADLGFKDWALGASAAALIGLGWWTYRYRGADRWVLIGVAALVARLWIYHRVYDDVLVVLAMVALFRIAKKSADPKSGVVAGVLLAITITVMLFPARWEFFPASWYWFFIGGHALVWIVDLVFLASCAREQSIREAAL